MFGVIKLSIKHFSLREYLVFIEMLIVLLVVNVAIGLTGSVAGVGAAAYRLASPETITLDVLPVTGSLRSDPFLSVIHAGARLEALAHALNRLPNVAWHGFVQVSGSGLGNGASAITLIGADPGYLAAHPFPVVMGRTLSAPADTSATQVPILVSPRIAVTHPLGTIWRRPLGANGFRTCRVVGVLPASFTFWRVPYNLSAQMLTGGDAVVFPLTVASAGESTMASALASGQSVRLKQFSPARFEAFQRGVVLAASRLHLGVHFHTIGEAVNQFRAGYATQITFTTLVAAVLFLLSIFGLCGVLLANIPRRMVEVGIRFAVGSTTRGVLGLFFAEVCCLVIPAWMISSLALMALSAAVSDSVFQFSAFDATLSLGLSALICLLGMVSILGVIRRWSTYHLLKGGY